MGYLYPACSFPYTVPEIEHNRLNQMLTVLLRVRPQIPRLLPVQRNPPLLLRFRSRSLPAAETFRLGQMVLCPRLPAEAGLRHLPR